MRPVATTPATETELTPEQTVAVEAMGFALQTCLAAMEQCTAAGLDPMAVIAAGLPPEALAELPLPLRMMLG